MKHIPSLALAAVLTLTACAQNPATGGQMFTTVSKAQELEIGQASAEAELKRYGLYKPDSRATKYVQNLCNKVYAQTEMAADPLQCLVINSPTYNAWATPGYINVYRGFLPYVSSEAELVSVLAHEAGHINARHIAQGATQQMMGGLLATGVGILVAAKTNNSQMANAAYTVSALGAGAAVMAYSRAHELEADSLGQRYMERAGYDKRESLNMMRGMQAYQAFDTQVEAAYNEGKVAPQSLMGRLYASHPATPDRIATAQKTAGGEPDGSLKLASGFTPATPQNDPQGRKRYLEAITGLEVGPARKWGIAGSSYLVVPSKRMLWMLPSGFFTRYTEDANADTFGEWRGVNPSTGVAFAATFAKFQPGLNPGTVIVQNFPEFKNTTPQRLEISGETAYTATASAGGRGFRIIAMPLDATESMGFIAIRYPDAASVATHDAAIVKALQKSRMISEDRAKYFQPLEISAFTASAGDTVASRAAKLPAGALQTEWFRALNTLEPGDTLKPGRAYKTVIDPNLSLL